MGTIQPSSTCRYELQDTWSNADTSYCRSAPGYKGCAWRPTNRGNHQCSYVNDTQSFSYYPGAAPLSQTAYGGGYVDSDTAPSDVCACPTEDNRYVEIAVRGSLPLPTCLCKYSKINCLQNGTTFCFTEYGKIRVSCDADLFQDTAWNEIELDTEATTGVVDQGTVVFVCVGIVAAVLGVVLQRRLKRYRDADEDKASMITLYTLLEEDAARDA